MRLLFVNEKLDYASTSSYSLDLAVALRSGGDQVRLCVGTGRRRETFQELGIETYVAKNNFFSFRKLLDYLREFAPDLIHVQNQRSAPLGRKLSSRLRIPHVVTVHRPRRDDTQGLEHPLLSGVIALSEVIREFLVNEQGLSKSLIRVIRRGVNLDELRPERAPSALRTEGAYLPVIGSVGRLERIKGHDVLINAARRVLDAGYEAMFIIVGDGDEEPALRKLVEELRLEHHVTFAPPLPKRVDLFRLFDIVAVPTRRGGVGATALEAMAMGKPVIATAMGELLEIVGDHTTGLLVPEGDADALAAAIVELIRDRELASELGRRARQRVRDEFALAPMVEATRTFYAESKDRMLERSLTVSG